MLELVLPLRESRARGPTSESAHLLLEVAYAVALLRPTAGGQSECLSDEPIEASTVSGGVAPLADLNLTLRRAGAVIPFSERRSLGCGSGVLMVLVV